MPRTRRRRLARQRRKHGVIPRPKKASAWSYAPASYFVGPPVIVPAPAERVPLPRGFTVKLVGKHLSRRDRRKLAATLEGLLEV